MKQDLELGIKTPEILSEIAKERTRQIDTEGWTQEHDDAYLHSELAIAGAAYALSGAGWEKTAAAELWPSVFDYSMFKPKNHRRDLVRAAALIVSEIERLDRIALNRN